MVSNQESFRFKSLSQFHRFRNLPQPKHPLISVIDMLSLQDTALKDTVRLIFEFYVILVKRGFAAKVKYGQHPFEYGNGVIGFQAPGQVVVIEPPEENTVMHPGWLLLIHPDFLWNTPLAKKIKQYGFFDYTVNKALMLSETEEAVVNGIIGNIEREYRLSNDKFSQEIVIAQLEALLAYCDRFCQRQFIGKNKSNHQILDRLERLLDGYLNSDGAIKSGVLTVSNIAGQLNVSPSHLSAFLRSMTGMNTRQHIHDKLINKAKELLSTTELPVSEIAYSLGFGHIQSFSRLFKTKTTLSPLEFRCNSHYLI